MAPVAQKRMHPAQDPPSLGDVRRGVRYSVECYNRDRVRADIAYVPPSTRWRAETEPISESAIGGPRPHGPNARDTSDEFDGKNERRPSARERRADRGQWRSALPRSSAPSGISAKTVQTRERGRQQRVRATPPMGFSKPHQTRDHALDDPPVRAEAAHIEEGSPRTLET